MNTTPSPQDVEMKEIIKRDGRRQPYTRDKIEQAVYKCLHDGLEKDNVVSGAIAREIAERVEERLESAGAWPVGIEAIQDLVEDTLIDFGYRDAAKAYIRYRALREEERLKSDVPDSLRQMVAGAVKRAAEGLADVSAEAVIQATLENLFPGCSVRETQQAMVLAARTFIERDPNYSYLASRLLLELAYEEATGEPATFADMQVLYRTQFRDYLEYGVDVKRLDPQLLDASFDHAALADALLPECDRKFKYFGTQTLYDRYLLHENGRRYELPQWFWMRVAMGLALAEKPEDRTRWAIRFYEKMAQHLYCPSTPTLFNAGTIRPQLSSCFLMQVEDDLNHILDTPRKAGLLSKYSGGLGIALQKIRGMNALIQGTNGKSSGLLPWMKIYDASCNAVDQGGKRKGAWDVYTEDWHIDVEAFIEARRNTGDERLRVRDLHTALWTNDLFWQRLQQDGEWTLFSPDETPDLPFLCGAAFRARYEAYEAMADRGEIRLFKRIKAKDLFRKIAQMIFETGHPWICYKDAANLRSPQDHVGTIFSSNLCTEIEENTGIPKLVPYYFKEGQYHLEVPASVGPDWEVRYRPGRPEDEEVAVCNLGSIVVPNHLVRLAGWGGDQAGAYVLDNLLLEDTILVAHRALDNVIDINLYAIPEARQSNMRHRPIGLGMMGLQDALFMLGIDFASESAVTFSDQLWEYISYYTLEASAELAQERGSYPSFKDSKWNRGLLPIDTLQTLEDERGEAMVLNFDRHLDWDRLREKVQQGVRNSNHMALAPTATIGSIIGTSPVSEPYQYNLYVEATMSGNFTVVNDFMVQALKDAGLWDQEMLDDLKYYNGSLQEIERVPQALKDRFKTCFEIEPYWVIAAAARRQKWIDQSQSTNIWYRGTSMAALRDIYLMAWRMGLKTTYYLRTEAATEIEKSTIDVNRYGIQPKWMKSKSASAEVQVDREPEPEIKLCRLDDPTCESCQ